MKLSVVIALVLFTIGTCEGMIRSLWCYKCMGSECNSPVDSTKDMVWITECKKGICYEQESNNEGTMVTSRGCYKRRSDCVPGCQGPPEHQTCEKCCEQNLCNNAKIVTFDILVLIISSLLGFFMIRQWLALNRTFSILRNISSFFYFHHFGVFFFDTSVANIYNRKSG